MPIEAVAQRLSTTLAIPGCWVRCRPSVGSLPCGAASLGGRIYAFTRPQVVLRFPERPGGCGPVGANPQRIKTDAGGMAQPGAILRTMPALDGRCGHDSVATRWSPLRVATSCASFDWPVCAARFESAGCGRGARLVGLDPRTAAAASSGWSSGHPGLKTLLPGAAASWSGQLLNWRAMAGATRRNLWWTTGPAGSLAAQP